MESDQSISPLLPNFVVVGGGGGENTDAAGSSNPDHKSSSSAAPHSSLSMNNALVEELENLDLDFENYLNNIVVDTNNSNTNFLYYDYYDSNYSAAAADDFDLDSLLHDLQGKSSSFDAFYLILALYISVILVGVLGNLMVLIAVIGKEKMRTPRNLFISTLAVSDLFLCLFSLPITLWELFVEAWPFGPHLQLSLIDI